MARLAGKTAIITGAAAGIGLAASRLFAREGARLLLVDRAEAPLSTFARELGAGHVVADVTRVEDTQRYVAAAVERLSGIDILLANAGVLGDVKPITDYPVETFDRVIAINVRGVWLGLKYVMPEMAKRGGGSIVITSSTAGVRGTPGLSAYNASKHAAVGIMRSAALEGAPHKIRVNTVNPSPIETAMIRELEDGIVPGDRSKAQDALRSRNPLGRYGSPEEVARLMLFLASDESSFTTGGVHMIDGGRTAM